MTTHGRHYLLPVMYSRHRFRSSEPSARLPVRRNSNSMSVWAGALSFVGSSAGSPLLPPVRPIRLPLGCQQCFWSSRYVFLPVVGRAPWQLGGSCHAARNWQRYVRCIQRACLPVHSGRQSGCPCSHIHLGAYVGRHCVCLFTRLVLSRSVQKQLLPPAQKLPPGFTVWAVGTQQPFMCSPAKNQLNTNTNQ